MEDAAHIIILITTANADEAQQISRLLLEQRKIACANIIPEVNSRFWWHDQIESARESLLIAKTKASLLPEIIDIVKGAHSYTVPEIIALPVVGGNQDYLEWIDKSTS